MLATNNLYLMVLEYCPNCEKKLFLPFKSSGRQVCTSCGWHSHKKSKPQKIVSNPKILGLSVFTLIFLITSAWIINDSIAAKKQFEKAVYYSSRRDNFESLNLLNYVGESTMKDLIRDLADDIFIKTAKIGDSVTLKDDLHKYGKIIRYRDERYDNKYSGYFVIKWENEAKPEHHNAYGLSIVDSKGLVKFSFEDAKKEAENLIEEQKKEEELISLRYSTIIDTMSKNFNVGNTVVLKDDLLKKNRGKVIKLGFEGSGYVEVQWQKSDSTFRSTGYYKMEELMVIDRSTGIVLWRPPQPPELPDPLLPIQWLI